MSAPETSTPVPDEEIGYLASEHFAQHTGKNAEEEEASINDSSTLGEDIEKGTIHLESTYYHHPHNYHPNRIQSSRPGTRPGTRPSTRPASPTKRHDDGDEGDGDETETEREHEHEHPILAPDEVLKRAGSSLMFPAVSPPLAAWRSNSTANNTRPATPSRHNIDDEDSDVEPVNLSGRGFESRESLVRSALESGERPEPLFPDSDPEEDPTGTKTPAEKKNSEKPKRPGMPESVGSSCGHRFPSKDVWEEAPEFSQLEAIVSTRPPSETDIADEDHEAESPVQKRRDGKSAAGVAYIHGQPNEHYVPGDEVEFERKQKDSLKKPAQYQHQVNSSGRDDGLDRLLKKGNSSDDPEKLRVARAKVKRFPSNDLWEDVPPSLALSASIGEEDTVNVSGAEPKDCATTGESIDPAEKEVEKRPTTSAPIEGPSSPATVPKPELPARPVVPAARPPAKPRPSTDSHAPATEKKFPPVLPGRPKPKVGPPIRPARPSSIAAARSPSSEVSSPATKPRPSVPPRASGKIALKAGFLSDLDNRLKLGPQAPKKEEEKGGKAEDKKKEKVVLEDVRKGRAKGPRRKLPTATEKTEKTEKVVEKKAQVQTMSMGVWAVWSVGDAGVNILGESAPVQVARAKVEKEKGVPVPTTSTLSGVGGAGLQSEPVVSKDDGEDAPSAMTSTAEEKERGEIPTLVPAEERPDTVPAAMEKSETTSGTGTGTGTVEVEVEDSGKVDAGAVATERDVRVEV